MWGFQNFMKMQEYSMQQLVLEVFVRQKLLELKNDPRRTTKKLVDMVQHLSTGRLQKILSALTQEIKQNEQSGYYSWLHDMTRHVNVDRLLGFGMNLGYHSLTIGTEKIRQTEVERGFGIPWAISLKIDGIHYEETAHKYRELIRQGKELGIFTWFLFADEKPEKLLPLFKSEFSCAFILFTNASAINTAFMYNVGDFRNLMISVRFDNEAISLCKELCRRELLYAVHLPYDPQETTQIIADDVLSHMEELYPAVAFFLPKNFASERNEPSLCDYAEEMRLKKMRRVPTAEFWEDCKSINHLVSESDFALAFDEHGNVYPDICGEQNGQLNFIKSPLADILKACSKKKINT